MTEQDDMNTKKNNNVQLRKDELEIIKPLEVNLEDNRDQNNELDNVIELTDPVSSYSENFEKPSDTIIETGIETEVDDLDIADQLLVEDSLDLKLLKLENIEKQVDRLCKDFNSKIKYDAHKEKIIDRLHSELQEYKNGLINEQILSIAKDIIKIIDDITRLRNQNISDNKSDLDASKLINYISTIGSDLEDILIMQDVTPFRADDDIFQPDRQKILKKVEGNDPSMDKKVIESLYPGYDFFGKIVRPEMVTVNIYANQSTGKEQK